MTVDLGDQFENVYALARQTNEQLHRVINRLVVLGAAELRKREREARAEADVQDVRVEASSGEPRAEQETS